jgi:hypothetical protein
LRLWSEVILLLFFDRGHVVARYLAAAILNRAVVDEIIWYGSLRGVAAPRPTSVKPYSLFEWNLAC